MSNPKRKLTVLLVLALGSLAGCGGPYTDDQALRAGIDLTKPAPLLALEHSQARETHGRVSGAFLFAFGGVGGSIDSKLKRYVGFIAQGEDGLVFQVTAKAEEVDYRLDPNAERPSVKWFYENGDSLDGGLWDDSESVTANLEEDWTVSHVLITLAPADFERDVHVLQYAGAGG